jgi:hypothetical protein
MEELLSCEPPCRILLGLQRARPICEAQPEEASMDSTMILFVVIALIVPGGGGWYDGRRFF